VGYTGIRQRETWVIADDRPGQRKPIRKKNSERKILLKKDRGSRTRDTKNLFVGLERGMDVERDSWLVQLENKEEIRAGFEEC